MQRMDVQNKIRLDFLTVTYALILIKYWQYWLCYLTEERNS